MEKICPRAILCLLECLILFTCILKFEFTLSGPVLHSSSRKIIKSIFTPPAVAELYQSDPASMESKLEMCLSVYPVFVQHQLGLSLTLPVVFIFISFYNSDQVQVCLP